VGEGRQPVHRHLPGLQTAPETAQSPWCQQSRAYLLQRLPRGRQVSIQPHTTDRYGRTVAEGISDINMNLAMVEDGQAVACRQSLSKCDAKEDLDAEYRSSRRRYGVWQVEGGISQPWDSRRQRRCIGPGDDIKRTQKSVQHEQAEAR